VYQLPKWYSSSPGILFATQDAKMEPNEEDTSEWLLGILSQVQLEQFYVRIRDHLQISRISHFDYVTPDDLEKVSKFKDT
jgi:hypothetical protein